MLWNFLHHFFSLSFCSVSCVNSKCECSILHVNRECECSVLHVNRKHEWSVLTCVNRKCECSVLHDVNAVCYMCEQQMWMQCVTCEQEVWMNWVTCVNRKCERSMLHVWRGSMNAVYYIWTGTMNAVCYICEQGRECSVHVWTDSECHVLHVNRERERSVLRVHWWAHPELHIHCGEELVQSLLGWTLLVVSISWLPSLIHI